MISLWEDASLPHFPRLQGDTKTDVLIVGGGIAGLLTAIFSAAGRDSLYCSGSRTNQQRHHQVHHRQSYLPAWTNIPENGRKIWDRNRRTVSGSQ